MITTQFSPYRLEEAIHIAPEHTLPLTCCPATVGLQGLPEAGRLQHGQGITITLWEGEEDGEIRCQNSSY